MNVRSSRVRRSVLVASGLIAALGVRASAQPAAHDELSRAAQASVVEGDLTRAESHYQQLVSRVLDALGNLRVDLGIARFRQGDLEAARSDAMAALALAPENTRAHNLLGRIELLRGDTDAAIDHLRKVVEEDPDFDAAYTLGLAYLTQRNVAEATSLFDRIVDASQPSAAVHVLLGRAYREHEVFDRAIAEFQQAIALDRTAPHTHYHLGLTYLLQGQQQRFPEAQAAFEAELQVNPQAPLAQFFLGVIHLSARQFAEAEPLLERAVALRADSPDAWLYLGQLRYETDQFARAIEALRRSIALTPDVQHNDYQVARAHYQLAVSLQKLGQTDEASAEFARVAELRAEALGAARERAAQYFDPQPGTSARTLAWSEANRDISGTLGTSGTWGTSGTHGRPHAIDRRDYGGQALSTTFETTLSTLLADAYYNLGVIAARHQRFDVAVSRFARASEWKADFEGLDRAWGFAAYHAGRYMDGIEPLARHVAKQPDDTRALQILGLSYFMTGDYAQSAEILRPMLAHPPEDRAVLYALGSSLLSTGKTEEVVAAFSTLRERFPAAGEIRLVLGQAFATTNQYTKALDEFAGALAVNPHLARAHYLTGLLLVRQGRMDEAERRFRQELQLTPSDADARYHLAYALLSLQRTDEALTLLQGVIADRPDYADAHYQLGKTLRERGDVKPAIEHLERATALDPEQEHYLFQLSGAYRDDRRLADAQRILELYQRAKAKKR